MQNTFIVLETHERRSYHVELPLPFSIFRQSHVNLSPSCRTAQSQIPFVKQPRQKFFALPVGRIGFPVSICPQVIRFVRVNKVIQLWLHYSLKKEHETAAHYITSLTLLWSFQKKAPVILHYMHTMNRIIRFSYHCFLCSDPLNSHP